MHPADGDHQHDPWQHQKQHQSEKKILGSNRARHVTQWRDAAENNLVEITSDSWSQKQPRLPQRDKQCDSRHGTTTQQEPQQTTEVECLQEPPKAGGTIEQHSDQSQHAGIQNQSSKPDHLTGQQPGPITNPCRTGANEFQWTRQDSHVTFPAVVFMKICSRSTSFSEK